MALDKAAELGINFIDTAEVYGRGESERLLGEFLAGRREQFVIATKFTPTHLTQDGILKACSKSLERLDVRYVDLYQVHWYNPVTSIRTTMKAMERLYVDQMPSASPGASALGERGCLNMLDAFYL